jgi:hypothetical protein
MNGILFSQLLIIMINNVLKVLFRFFLYTVKVLSYQFSPINNYQIFIRIPINVF